MSIATADDLDIRRQAKRPRAVAPKTSATRDHTRPKAPKSPAKLTFTLEEERAAMGPSSATRTSSLQSEVRKVIDQAKQHIANPKATSTMAIAASKVLMIFFEVLFEYYL